MISEDNVYKKGHARLKWFEGQEAMRARPTRCESAVTSARLFRDAAHWIMCVLLCWPGV